MTLPSEITPPPIIKPEADSKLAQLLAVYESVKARAAEYEARLEGLKNEIKQELIFAAPGHNTILLESDYLSSRYRLSARTIRRCDTTALRRAEPDVWERYAKARTSWYFEVAR